VKFIAQGVRKSKQAFGGVQIVASGDFKQLPPVSTYGVNFVHIYLISRVLRGLSHVGRSFDKLPFYLCHI